MSPHDAMLDSLERIGEAGIDPVPLFFERFFAQYPQEQALFLNPGHSHGAMASEMLTMLLGLAEDAGWVAPMMRIQLMTHRSHGEIASERYGQALTALIDVLREAAGAGWLPAHEAAWQEQAQRLAAIVAQGAADGG